MRRYVFRFPAGIILCLLLFEICHAAADATLLFAMPTDVLAYAEEGKSSTVEAGSALILAKGKTRDEKNAVSALKDMGIEDVLQLSFTTVSAPHRTGPNLQKHWMKDTQLSRLASALRRRKTETLVFYSAEEEVHAFLSDLSLKACDAAADPTVSLKNQSWDEYVHYVSRVLDGKTLEEKTPVFSNGWKGKWGMPAEPDLFALGAAEEDGFFSSEKEAVLKNPEEGIWAYLSDTLRIVITRQQLKGLRWFEADIRRKEGGEAFQVIASPTGKGMKPAQIAREANLVFAINTDYYHYRIHYNKKAGLIIRGGQVIRESPGKTTGRSLPPLDTLLLDENGVFRVDTAGELDSRAALALGARDVLSFGPILVKNSLPRLLLTDHKAAKEPRTAIGCIENNHYLVVVVEGRLNDSRGISLTDLSQLMAARGCRDAINLDGGHTSALVFMGERLNKIGSLNGNGTSGTRSMIEVLGIGYLKENAEQE